MIVVDHLHRTVSAGGRTVRPRRQAFALIAYLSAHPGAVRSREQIMDALGMPEDRWDRAVDSAVKHCREALRPLGVTPIRAAWGVGYYWEE